ncbi:MAG: bifunctional N(6)-L-threonylcarbamoyladenine synthase/serine/threonine protein kinase [Thermoproteota archaeon]
MPKEEKICLGIECTAHTLGLGLVRFDGKVLSDVRRTYKPEAGGIHPRESARFMASSSGDALRSCFEEAGISPKQISLVSFSQGPGLGPCLRTGATLARAISSYLRVPLVGVNHCIAHIEAGRRYGDSYDPVVLYVSGGSTQVISYSAGFYRVFGETEDIAIGNLLDAFAREAGLPFPGGPEVERLSSSAKKFIDLPYSVKGMNVSFSGLLTRMKSLIPFHEIEDLCYSLQETAFSMLVEVSERAMAFLRKDELLLIGGVAVNKRLREMCRTMCAERGASFKTVEPKLCLDNGVMIAWTGLLASSVGEETPIQYSQVKPKWRVDKVRVKWRS